MLQVFIDGKEISVEHAEYRVFENAEGAIQSGVQIVRIPDGSGVLREVAKRNTIKVVLKDGDLILYENEAMKPSLYQLRPEFMADGSQRVVEFFFALEV